MDSLCLPIEQILDSCEDHVARLQQSNTAGFIEIQCCPIRGQYKTKCQYGFYRNFLIAPEDLAVWKTPPLLRQRETLETVDQVMTMLNSALFETFHLQQGHANILIWHREQRSQYGQYGFQFCPSIVHGIKLC
ncbi:hypothetical protein [Halotia branconii]|uniref:Uncharacterized protein n=1 Tax=Halotia branconii CENA392 TaxID=1539056 RepID=A0AAJ6P8Q2_9CYAN|nr:hypothetical protein [Halotia branconii]WGV24856.1 hypothetical protein QI031_24310 [Halotia branconii CENA392]